jgi:hypothetical protein
MLLNFNAEPRPPRLALPVGVGIGKTRAMQRSVAGVITHPLPLASHL